MVTDFMMTFVSMIVYLLDLFNYILTSFGAWIYFIAGFTIFTIFRFVLFPLLGGRSINLGSDRVSKSNKSKSKEGND